MAIVSKKNFASVTMPSGFPDHGFAIAPVDADSFDAPVNVYAGGAGTVVVEAWNPTAPGATVSVSVVAGGCVPFRVRRVLATGTTATNLIGSL